MTWTCWAAVVIVILTVAALVKRYETRLVLIAAGLLMTCLALEPMQALNAFAKSMTNGGLIMAICSAMGFAYVVQMTKCDVHLVKLLAAPLVFDSLHDCDHILYLYRDSVSRGLRGRGRSDHDSASAQSGRQSSGNRRSNSWRNIRIHAVSGLIS